MFFNLNIKNIMVYMKKEMFFGIAIFVGYIYGVNYFIRKKLYPNNEENEQENEEIQLQTIYELQENKQENFKGDTIGDKSKTTGDTKSETTGDKSETIGDTKSDIKKLFEKKAYLIELDKQLSNIKDKLQEIRDNLHNFN